jgi:hypothetical protein
LIGTKDIQERYKGDVNFNYQGKLPANGILGDFMESRRMNYLHGLMLDYGLFIRDGMTCSGVFGTSQWSEGKPKPHTSPAQSRRSRLRRKPLVPPTQPQETRSAHSKTPIIRIDYRSEQIHPVVVAMPDTLKIIICCLYIRGLCFKDTAQALNMTSRQIGKAKHKVLVSIDNVL